MTLSPKTSPLRTVKQIVELYPSLTEGQLRAQLDRRFANGLEKAVVKRGRRVLIDAEKFEVWYRGHKASQEPPITDLERENRALTRALFKAADDYAAMAARAGVDHVNPKHQIIRWTVAGTR